ncbi:MAG: hypothetical protein AB7F91_07810 [Parvularculaceae bacterium]
MKRWIIAAAMAVAGAANAGEPTPLFSSDAPIALSISAPWRDVARKAPEDAPIDAVLTYEGVDYPIELTTRGKSRRAKNVCTFPPLRVAFKEKPPKGSLFHKQKKLKLVTYCRKSANHQQYVLAEEAAYRLYNKATPESFRTRLADISYVEPNSGKVGTVRTGFFIEDVDDLAKRVDREEVERARTPLEMFNRNAAARVAVFQYMIGNLDWELTAGPEGEDCCHNGKLIGPAAGAESDLVSAPYDFDMSGLVDAPYALPPEQFKIRTVTTRVYRGYCAHNEETRAAAAAFRNARGDYDAAVSDMPGLSDRTKEKMLKFLGGFFDDVADDAAVEKNLLSKCRG